MTTATRRPGTGAAYRCELRKLAAQRRTYLGFGAAVLVSLIFVAAIALDGSGGHPELPFGTLVRQSGLATSLLCLSFGAFWLMPLVTALVAGDIIAAEDQHGTLKTILTRSVQRHNIWTAKALAALTYALAALLMFVVTGLVAGSITWGFGPLTFLSGTPIATGRGLVLIGASTLAYAMPIIAFCCIGLLLSTLTRNSAAAVVGTLMFSILLQLVDVLGVFNAARPYLLTTQSSRPGRACSGSRSTPVRSFAAPGSAPRSPSPPWRPGSRSSDAVT